MKYSGTRGAEAPGTASDGAPGEARGRADLGQEATLIRTCPSCGQKNRLQVGRLAEAAQCGSCKAGLPPLAEPVEADPALFDEVVRGTTLPVFVDFWAAWCGPCRAAAPEVQRAASAMAGRAVVLKVDTEAHPDLAERYGVRGIPNFLILKDGGVVFQHAGLVDHAQMEQWLVGAGA